MPIVPDRPTVPSTKGNERWQQWLAKGVAHDADVRHRAKVVVGLTLSTVALVLAVTLGLN